MLETGSLGIRWTREDVELEFVKIFGGSRLTGSADLGCSTADIDAGTVASSGSILCWTFIEAAELLVDRLGGEDDGGVGGAELGGGEWNSTPISFKSEFFLKINCNS